MQYWYCNVCNIGTGTMVLKFLQNEKNFATFDWTVFFVKNKNNNNNKNNIMIIIIIIIIIITIIIIIIIIINNSPRPGNTGLMYSGG